MKVRQFFACSSYRFQRLKTPLVGVQVHIVSQRSQCLEVATKAGVPRGLGIDSKERMTMLFNVFLYPQHIVIILVMLIIMIIIIIIILKRVLNTSHPVTKNDDTQRHRASSTTTTTFTINTINRTRYTTIHT